MIPLVWTGTGFYPLTDSARVYAVGVAPPAAAIGPRPRVAVAFVTGVAGTLRILDVYRGPSAQAGASVVTLCHLGPCWVDFGRVNAAERGSVYVGDFTAGDVDDGTGRGVPDGGVDISDLLAFLAWYEAGDVHADFDPDGAVTVADLLAFLSAFERGGAC